MIPEFPKFKPLELSDKKDVEKITQKYPPYSDFNFVSMCSWDIKGEMRISMLNGNLIVHFTDYVTGKPFYSFLGDEKVNETIEKLLELSKKEGLKPLLKLVPEIALKNMDLKKYHVEEDPDHFDYIYKTEHLAHLSGRKFHNKRWLCNRFSGTYSNIKVISVPHVDEKTKEDIIKLDKKWAQRKAEKTVDFDIKNETMALEKFFTFAAGVSNSKFIFFCVYVENELVGFSISSIMNEEYVLCHFNKGNIKYGGVYEYMLKNYNERLMKIAQFMNYEQDLGIPSLRFTKNSFRPSAFFKKYVILEI